MKTLTGAKHKYSATALNRGAVLSMFVVVLILITFISGFGFKNGLLSAPLTLALSAVFFGFNLYWDRKIKANHMKFDVLENSIIFFSGNKTITVDRKEVKKMEYFPDSHNPFDDDFVNNFMSSGIRILTHNNDKFLIFSKVSGFDEVRRVLNRWEAPANADG